MRVSKTISVFEQITVNTGGKMDNEYILLKPINAAKHPRMQ
jgi:hypothetical protein